MLVLSRRCSESVRIGEDIRITIVRLERGRVRIGIEAPDQVAIWREELGPEAASAADRVACAGAHA